MKKSILSFLAAFLFLSFSITSFAQQDQRIHASYMLVFGRDASQGEVNYWLGRGNLSLAQLIDFNKQYLKQDGNTHRNTINQSYIDAFGRYPRPDELNTWLKTSDTYSDIIKSHIAYLQAGYANEYSNVIRRSYQYVFNRQPAQNEINYWKGQPVYSYLMLVAQHQDFYRRNIAKENSQNNFNPGNSAALVGVRVSADIASEIRNTGLVASGAGNLVASGAGNLVASGAGNLVASGAGNLVASGAGN